MSGRLEHKNRNENNIENILVELPDCVTSYYNSRSMAKESKGSVEYIRKIRRFLQSIDVDTKKIDIAGITENDVVMYLRSVERTTDKNGVERETTFAYRKQIYSILFSFFEYLRKKKIVVENPMDCIERPNTVDNVKPLKLDEFDLRTILKAVDNGAGTDRQKNRQENWKERDRAILLLFMNTGIRETALTEINLGDIDFTCNTITVIDKRHKTHIYTMNSVLKEALSIWLSKRKELLGVIQSDALFISSKRSRLSEDATFRIVRKYSQAGLGYPVSPHKLRAAFCTILYDRTHDIEKVREAVGHSAINTTQRYIVTGNRAKEEAAYIMGDIFD